MERLEQKIDALKDAFGEVRELLAGKVATLEAGIHSLKGSISGLDAKVLAVETRGNERLQAADTRIDGLVADKHRAEGAVWAWRVAAGVLAAAAGAASHILLGK